MKADAEKGSALMIVFVLAAIVAVTLYMEMPVTVFEAKRQNEQITIDHGKEYAHAVKLFVRKIGRYPSSLDELENTNNMRFLRHKFKDPFTGDSDWRLLHAGPGGVIIDSKVKPVGTSTFTGNTGAAGSGANNGTSNSTNSGSNATNSSSAANGNNTSAGSSEPEFPMAGSIAAEATAAVQPPAPKRPPAIAANGSNAAKASSDQSTWQSLVPPIPGEQNDAAGQANANPAANTNAAAGANAQTAGAGGAANGQPSGQSNGQLNGQTGSSTNGPGQNTAGNMQNMLNQMSGSGGQTAAGSTGTAAGTNTGALGTMAAGGGVAGVAVPDKVSGLGIKAVNDQHKYQLWEFYYDPTQDTLKIPGTQSPQGTNQTGTGAMGTSAAGNNNGSIFGSNGSSGTSFGSQPSNSNSTSNPGTSSTSTTASPQQ